MTSGKRKFSRLAFVVIALNLAESSGLWWSAGGPLILQPRRICRKVDATGGESQKNICRRDRQLLREIVKGVEIGMDECQFQLRNHRWNCTTRRRSLGKMLLRDTKEAAIVQATTASAVAHVVAHACGKGKLSTCTCRHSGRRYRATDSQWHWNGCGDNLDFGYQKSLEFMDIGTDKARDIRAKILHHNNEVGRLAIKSHMGVKCKCHGLSASCELKTCWPKMPSFRQTGEVLLRKFNAAKPVTPDNAGGGSFLFVDDESHRIVQAKKIQRHRNAFLRDESAADSDDDRLFLQRMQNTQEYVPAHDSHRRLRELPDEALVYTETSPNLCKTNRKIGILGTRGRACNATASDPTNEGGCEYLCCGRGHFAETVVEETNCNCRFRWCCEVICERCKVTKTLHFCR